MHFIELRPSFQVTFGCLDDLVYAVNPGRIIGAFVGGGVGELSQRAAARPDRRFYRASHLALRTSHITQYPSTPHCSKVCETGGCGQYPFGHFAVSFVKTILT